MKRGIISETALKFTKSYDMQIILEKIDNL